VLDKKWIFYHTTRNGQNEARKFILYSCLGWPPRSSSGDPKSSSIYLSPGRLLNLRAGGSIGLKIDYLVKYRLDKRFVFIHHQEEAVT
jgi:hypothetical protein